MPRLLLIFSQTNDLIQIVATNYHKNDKMCRSRSVCFLEASWSGSTLFAKAGMYTFSRIRVKSKLKLLFFSMTVIKPRKIECCLPYQCLPWTLLLHNTQVLNLRWRCHNILRDILGYLVTELWYYTPVPSVFQPLFLYFISRGCLSVIMLMWLSFVIIQPHESVQLLIWSWDLLPEGWASKGKWGVNSVVCSLCLF